VRSPGNRILSLSQNIWSRCFNGIKRLTCCANDSYIVGRKSDDGTPLTHPIACKVGGLVASLRALCRAALISKLRIARSYFLSHFEAPFETLLIGVQQSRPKVGSAFLLKHPVVPREKSR